MYRRYNFSVMSSALLKINTELQHYKTFFSLEDFSLFKIVIALHHLVLYLLKGYAQYCVEDAKMSKELVLVQKEI